MAMVNSTRLVWFLFLVFVWFVYEGCSQSEDCPTFALFINQTETGRVMESKKEWDVTIRHICVTCQVSHVNLTCPNLEKSLVQVNAAVISKTPDGNCQLIGGNGFDVNTNFRFTYVWDLIDFQPLNFYTYCY